MSEPTVYAFTDPVRGDRVVPHMERDAPGVEHVGCPYRAVVSPALDAFYCSHCGRSGRVDGRWLDGLLVKHGWGE